MKSIIRLFGYARKYWGWVCLAIISMFIVSITTALQAYLIKPLFDDLLLNGVQTSGNSAGLVAQLDSIYQALLVKLTAVGIHPRLSVALVIFFVMLLKNIFTFFSRYSYAYVGLTVVQDMRKYLYRRLLGMPLRFFTSSSTGELVARIVSDVIFIQQAMAERFGDIIQEGFSLLGLLIVIFSINAKLAFFSLLIAPLTLFPIVRFSRSMRKASKKSQQEMANMANILTETFQGNRIVNAFNAETYEYEKFVGIAGKHLKANLKSRYIQALNTPVIETLGLLLALGMFLYAGTEIARGTMSVGDFSSFLGALFMMYAPIKKLNHVNLAFQQASVAADRVFSIADQQDERVQDGTEILEGINRNITFEDVHFFYETKPAKVLDGVTFTIPKGQVVALVGSSGAGKSTVSAMLPRFYDPTSGNVCIDGKDIRSFTKTSLRDKMGIVTQETILFNDTVNNNIAYAMDNASPDQIIESAKAALAHDFIQKLPSGYDTVIGEAGITLSGGQRQRLSIARALIKDPPILILDEATSALDSESEKLVQEALDILMKGRTTLVIAHRLSTVKNADTILVIDRGKITEEGSHDELMKKDGTYAKMVKTQMFGGEA